MSAKGGAKMAGQRILVSMLYGTTLLGMLGGLGAGSALAQTKDSHNSAPITQEQDPSADPDGRNDTQRVNDSYQPRGVELGQFLLFPAIEMDTSWSSNVFATPHDAKSDRFLRVTPSARLRSRFTRHELNFYGELEKFIFDRYTKDNRLNGTATADGKLDIQKGWEATANVSYVDKAEDRGSPDVAQGLHPAKTHTLSAQAGTRLQQGRMLYQAGVSVDQIDIANAMRANGQVIDNSGRDRTEYEATGRVGYEMFPNYYALVEGAVNSRDYDNRVPGTTYKRSSDGYRVESGVGIDVTDLIRGDFLVGYMAQNYDNPGFSDPSGFSFRARFNWTPSRLTVIAPSLERTVQETVRAGSSGIVRTAAGVTVRHEFARNFVGTFIGNVAYENYQASSDDSWSYDARVRGIYTITREFYVGAEARYRQRDSDSGTTDYKQTTLMFKVGARY